MSVRSISNQELRGAFAVDAVLAMRKIAKDSAERIENPAREALNGGIWFANDYLKKLRRFDPVLAEQQSYLVNYRSIALPRPPPLRGHYNFSFPDEHASQALDRLIAGPTLLDCGLTRHVARLVAVRKYLGEERFDRLFKNRAISIRSGDPLFERLFPPSSQAAQAVRRGKHFFDLLELMKFLGASKRAYRNLQKAGEWLLGKSIYGVFGKRPLASGQGVRFNNDIAYLQKHPSGVAQGENVLCAIDPTGVQRFVGLGLPAAGYTEQEMISNHLKASYDSEESANLDGLIHKMSEIPRTSKTEAKWIPGFDPSDTEEVNIDFLKHIKSLPLEKIDEQAVLDYPMPAPPASVPLWKKALGLTSLVAGAALIYYSLN